MEKDELIFQYRNANDRQKRKILRDNSIDLSSLIGELKSTELLKLAELHPYKELLCDVLLGMMKNYKMSTSDIGNNYDVIKTIENTKKQGFFSRVIDKISGRDSKTIESAINQKIDEMKKINRLIGQSQVMRDDYWKLDLVNAEGNYKESTKDTVVGLCAFDKVVNKKVNDLYWEKAVKKYHYPHLEEGKEFYSEAYEELFEGDKKELAQLFGIAELTERDGSYRAESKATIDSVRKADNFTIAGENLGEIFIVDKSQRRDFKSNNKSTDIYRKNQESREFELIGSKYFSYDKECIELNIDGKEINELTSNISLDEKEILLSNEVHTKALINEMQKGLENDIKIAELSQVEIPNKLDSVFVVKTLDKNNNMGYKIVQLNSDPKGEFIESIQTAKTEYLKDINLPTVHATSDSVTRDTARVNASIDFNETNLQIYTDKHGKTRVAEIVDGNNAYPLITRNMYKNSELLENIEKSNEFVQLHTKTSPNKSQSQSQSKSKSEGGGLIIY